jgi:hypothetical protein
MRTLLSMAVLGALAIVGGTFAAGTLAGGSGEAMPAGALVKANGAPPKDHAVQRVDDGTWRLGSFKNTAGATCLEHEVPLEGVATGCLDLDRLFAERGDLIAMPGARQISSNTRKLSWDNAWVYGFVTARVASIELVRFDCTTNEAARSCMSRAAPSSPVGAARISCSRSTRRATSSPRRRRTSACQRTPGRQALILRAPRPAAPDDERARTGTWPARARKNAALLSSRGVSPLLFLA